MFTWNTYYQENLRRDHEIALAKQDRYIKSLSVDCQSGLTRLSIKFLEMLGSRLVQWGERLQCRCADLAMTRTNRAI